MNSSDPRGGTGSTDLPAVALRPGGAPRGPQDGDTCDARPADHVGWSCSPSRGEHDTATALTAELECCAHIPFGRRGPDGLGSHRPAARRVRHVGSRRSRRCRRGRRSSRSRQRSTHGTAGVARTTRPATPDRPEGRTRNRRRRDPPPAGVQPPDRCQPALVGADTAGVMAGFTRTGPATTRPDIQLPRGRRPRRRPAAAETAPAQRPGGAPMEWGHVGALGRPEGPASPPCR